MFRKLFYKLATHFYLGLIKSKNGFDALVLRQISITEAYEGSCTATFKVQEAICNEKGQMDGGFSTTLVDTITSTGLSTITINKPHVTVTLDMKWYRPANIGDDVVITSNILKLGKNLAFMEALIKNKVSGDLLVKGTHVKFILDKPS